jgi:hypothetical protein
VVTGSCFRAAIRGGDAVMSKLLLGLRLKTIINAPARRFPGKTAHQAAGIGQIECFTG